MRTPNKEILWVSCLWDKIIFVNHIYVRNEMKQNQGEINKIAHEIILYIIAVNVQCIQQDVQVWFISNCAIIH